jgi:hypothetical protein
MSTTTLCVIVAGEPDEREATMANSGQSRSVTQIEADLRASRARLANTVDQLAFRAQPKEIVRREKAAARRKFMEATHTPNGDLRVERIAAVLAAVSAVFITAGLLRRRSG